MRASINCRGFSLIETVLFIVIVGIAVAAIGQQFAINVRHSHEPLLRQQALAVASAYMDEILRKKWNHATPAGGGCVVTGSGNCADGPTAEAPPPGLARADYYTIESYDGLDEPPTDAEGTPMPGLAGFRVTVTVGNPSDDWHGIHRSDVLQIDVTVTTPNNDSVSLTAYRVNY